MDKKTYILIGGIVAIVAVAVLFTTNYEPQTTTTTANSESNEGFLGVLAGIIPIL